MHVGLVFFRDRENMHMHCERVCEIKCVVGSVIATLVGGGWAPDHHG